MNLIQKYYQTFKNYADNRAFRIQDRDISYATFFKYINGVRNLLDNKATSDKKPIGVICFDHIETYAGIFALWFSGKCFVPINPKHPLERNMAIINNTDIDIVLSTENEVGNIIDASKVQLLNHSEIQSSEDKVPVIAGKEQLMYILTTSGSTGVPKHVPIQLKNLEAYCNGFLQLFPELNSDACFLQTYDLTSDAAFTGYLLPLLAGACVYTLPEGQFKFLSIAGKMSDKNIDWVKLTPSVLSYLKPYISQLDLKHIRHFIFGGEALPLAMIKEWHPMFPDAEIANLYGPTETTISATVHKFSDDRQAKSSNGIVSIGRPLPDVDCILLNENQGIISGGEKGELCIAGEQTMSGYLNESRDEFIYITTNGIRKKYYRTGDLAKRDKDGNFYFLGRLDDQVKINGYRVNLAEVENAARGLVRGHNIAVITKEQGLQRIILFIEGFKGESTSVIKKLRDKLPNYMVPEDVIAVSSFPITTSGKIDRKKLAKDYL